MKFEITPEQSTTLTDCILRHTAANQTLNAAMAHHESVMMNNQQVSNDMWAEFEREFELDMTLDWQFMIIDNKPYIVSQKQQTPDADNN